MRKNQKITTIVKSALAVTLSLAMAATGVIVVQGPVSAADEVTPVKTFDFEKGFKEFYYGPQSSENPDAENNDPNFDIKTSPTVIYKKDKALGQVEEKETVDANGFVYTGTGSIAKYKTQAVTNTPGTSYDETKGTYLILGDTVELPALVKEKSAGADGATSAEASEALDGQLAVGAPAREAMTIKSAMTLSNPLSGKTGDAATVTYWAFVPEGTTGDISLMVFEGETDEAAFVYDPASAATPAGTWVHIAAVLNADGPKFYVNGAAVEDNYLRLTGDYNLSLFTAPAALLFGGCDDMEAKTVFGAGLDDVSFFDTALTEDQIKADYQAGIDAMNVTSDVENPDAFYSLSDLSQVTDIYNGKKPTDKDGKKDLDVVDDTINGASVKVMQVRGNTKGSERTGFYIPENPFAGEQLRGATIGYWFKQGLESGKTAVTVGNSLMLRDDPKYIYYHGEPEYSGKGFSYLYIQNNMSALYREGSVFSVAGHVDNKYSFTVNDGTDAGAAAEEAAKTAGLDWQYMTITMTNAGFKIYVNGQPVENKVKDPYGPRFLDGYFLTLSDRESPYKLNGIFGGTNNTQATQLMSFVSYPDTKMYFGNTISSESTYAKSGDSCYYNVSCYKTALTDDQVKALYDKEIAGLSGSEPTEGPDTTEDPGPSQTPAVIGDVSGDATVDANDSLEILKAVVKLSNLNEVQMKAADVNADGNVDANDSLDILKYVVHLITGFKAQS